MTDASSQPSVLWMAAPLVVSFVMRAAFTFVDTAFAATIGDSAVAAIGLAVPFEFLMIAIWVGLSTGLTSCLSRAMGAAQSRRIEQYVRAAWIIAIAVSPVFLVLGGLIWYGAERVGLDADVAREFKIYGAVLIGGSAFTAFWSIIPDSIVKAHQDTKATMWAGIYSNIANVVLNALFLFVFDWGVFGIGLSTVIGRLAGLGYALVIARRHERRRLAATTEHDGSEDAGAYWAILRLALPAAAAFGLMAGESGLINVLLKGMENAKEALAAYSIYYRVALFTLNPVIAVGIALLPFAARRWGEGDLDGMKRGLREGTVASVLYSVLLVGPVMVLLGPWIADLLAEEELTARYTAFSLQLVPVSCLTGVGFLLVRPAFEAMGRGTPVLVMALVRYLVLTAPMLWGGIVVARGMEQPPLYGLVVGLLAVSLVSSAAFSLWLKLAMPKTMPGPVDAGAPVPE